MGKIIKLKNGVYFNNQSIMNKVESGEERETGEYRNNKKVYIKEINCGAMSGDTLEVNHNINFEELWIDQAATYMIAPDGAIGPLPFLNAHNSNYSIELFLSNNGATIHMYSPSQRIYKAIVTLKYTKA